MPLQFDADMAKLKKSLLRMGNIAEQMIRDIKAVLANPTEEPLAVIYENERELDRLQVGLDEATIRLIGVYTPVAADLRLLLMATRINAEIERIGDKVIDICHHVENFLQNHSARTLIDFSHVATVAENMLHDALEAFADRSADRAAAVIPSDDEVDRITDQTFRALFTHMFDSPPAIGYIFGLMLTAQAFERIADHAVNIAEDVIYIVKGEDVRHSQADKGNDKQRIV